MSLAPDRNSKGSAVLTLRRTLLLILVLYLAGRLCQLIADRLPTLLIVVLHVVPPALFALAHGTALYRARGIAAFSLCCLGVAALAEIVGLRTGFPYGHYFFTGVMGPQIMHLPLLLVCAYLGIGYASWILAILALDCATSPLRGWRVAIAPLLAAIIMTSWDLAMEADWSTVDRVWIWRDGGALYGVPISNFLGWLLTTCIFYQIFAFYLRRRDITPKPRPLWFWKLAIALYAICAFGNLLLPFKPMAPPIVTDAAGVQWKTSTILASCIGVSVFFMGGFAMLAWRRLMNADAARNLEESALSR